MLAEISATQSFINIVLVGTVSFLLIGMGLRGRFQNRRRARYQFSGMTWLIPGVVGLAAAVYTALAESNYRYLGSSGLFVIVVLALMLTVGFAVLRKGWRGVRVGDHPYCRKCGFDLYGRPDGTVVCGECGAPLDAPRAMVTGELRRKPFMVSAGVVLIILTLAVGGGIVRSSWSTISTVAVRTWYSLKPEMLLVKDAETGSRSAHQELMRRWGKLELSNAAIERLLTYELSVPGRNTWYVAKTLWSIRDQWVQGRVSDSLARQSMTRAMNLTFEIAPVAGAGECLRFLVRTDDQGLSRSTYWWGRNAVKAEISDRKLRINGILLDESQYSDDAFGVPQDWHVLKGAGTRVDLSKLNLQPGQTINLEMSFTLTLACEAPGRTTLYEKQDFTFKGAALVVDPKQMYCTRIMQRPNAGEPDNADDAPLVPEALMDAGSIRMSLLVKDNQTTISFDVSPIPIAADLFIVDGNGERKLGPVVANDDIATSIKLDFVPSVDATYILRPNNALGVQLFAPLATHNTETTIAADQVQRRSE